MTMNNCQSCGVDGVDLSSVYRGYDFGRPLCALCRIQLYYSDHRTKGVRTSIDAEIVRSMCRAAEESIQRREHRERYRTTFAAHSNPEP
jgi:hypothetical protein